MLKPLKSGVVIAVALASVAMTRPALAAEADAQALAQCVRLSTDGRDRLVTVRWIMSALASAPQLSDVVKIDPQLKQQSDIGMAALFTRLLTVDCLQEAKVVFQSDESNAGIRLAGGALGEIAMNELFGNEDAAAGLETYTRYLNQSDFDVLRD